MPYQKEYTKEQINEFRTKDKRISWLSIFSSLCVASKVEKFNPTELEEIAYKLNDKLYEVYGFENGEEEKPL